MCNGWRPAPQLAAETLTGSLWRSPRRDNSARMTDMGHHEIRIHFHSRMRGLIHHRRAQSVRYDSSSPICGYGLRSRMIILYLYSQSCAVSLVMLVLGTYARMFASTQLSAPGCCSPQ